MSCASSGAYSIWGRGPSRIDSTQIYTQLQSRHLRGIWG